MTDPLNQGVVIENQNGVTLSIFVPRRMYCEIEDMCQRQGITFDNYFTGLHLKRYVGLHVESEGKNCPIEEEKLDELRQETVKKIKKK